MNYGTALAILIVALGARDVHAFGGKNFKVSEIKSVTETQVAWSEDTKKGSMMIRGSAAELLFKMIKEKHAEQLGSDALALTKNMTNTHWTVNGKQVTCSKITDQKKKKADYACAFEFDGSGDIRAGVEPFNPGVFNLAKTNVAVKFFKNGAKTRGLASATNIVYAKSGAYAIYDKDERPADSKYAMVVMTDQVARKFIEIFSSGKGASQFTKNGAKGWKGREIACVEAHQGAPERCAVVISFSDGGISTMKNPLF